jgi:N-formylmethionyl-tRNA deformylase
MPRLQIAKLGNPILRQMAAPIDSRDIRTYEVQQLIDNLLETMLAEPGIGFGGTPGVALGSTGCDGCEGEGEDAFPQTVLINPKIVFYGPQQVENWEGCLSVDGLRGKVTRPSVVRVQAWIVWANRWISKRPVSMPSVFNMRWIISSARCFWIG